MGLFSGSEAMTFDNVTEGIDTVGMRTYLDNLKVDLLDKVSEKIDDTQAVEDAINNGWQGVARDRFLSQFASARRSIKKDLEAEYKDLKARFKELERFYFEQDANMMD